MPSIARRSWVRHEDGGAAVGEVADHLPEDRVARDHVEAEGGVVEQQQLRRVAEGERQHHRALLALRQPAEGESRGTSKRAQPLGDRAPSQRGVQPRAEGGELRRRHLGRRVRLLGDHADPLP